LNARLTVRIAAEIDETCIVAVAATVDYDAAVDDEQEGMCILGGLGLIAPIRLAVRDASAKVLDDARALADTPACEHALTMQARGAYLQHVGPCGNRCHDALSSTR